VGFISRLVCGVARIAKTFISRLPGGGEHSFGEQSSMRELLSSVSSF